MQLVHSRRRRARTPPPTEAALASPLVPSGRPRRVASDGTRAPGILPACPRPPPARVSTPSPARSPASSCRSWRQCRRCGGGTGARGRRCRCRVTHRRCSCRCARSSTRAGTRRTRRSAHPSGSTPPGTPPPTPSTSRRSGCWASSGATPPRPSALFFLLGFPLAALTAYWLAREVGTTRPAAVAVGVLFSVLPGHQEWFHHLWLAAYWVVPLGPVARPAGGPWRAPRHRRARTPVAVGAARARRAGRGPLRRLLRGLHAAPAGRGPRRPVRHGHPSAGAPRRSSEPQPASGPCAA